MQLEAPEQQNFAPVGELEKLRKDTPTREMSLVEAAIEWRKEMRKEKESSEWQERIFRSSRNTFFYKGYQRGRRGEFSPTFRPESSKPIHFTLNEFAFWVNVNVAKWVNSRVDYRVRGIQEGDDAEMAAAKLERIARFYDDRDWRRTDVIKAAKDAQFEGHLVAYVYHDPGFASRKGWRPVLERKKVRLGGDAYRCADCGAVGELEGEAKQCAACGSQMLDVTQVPEYEVEQEAGKEPVATGDVTHELISIYNLSWKARRGLKDSDVVLWEAEYTREELEATYPGINIPASRTTDLGLQAKDSLSNAGASSKAEKTRYVLSRMWVEPERYCTYTLKEPVKHRQGEYPAGTKLKDVFPRGMHVIMLADVVVDVYPAVKNDDLVVMEYQSSSHGLAHGVDDMCEPQRLMNVGTSLMQAWLRHAAAPPLTYVNGVVNPGDLSGDLTKPIPIEASQIALFDGVSVENAIQYRQGQRFDPAIFAIMDKWRAAIQFAAHATEFNSGLPNVNNETATGARQTQSLSQSISSVPLAIFADFRAEIIKRKLKKFREWCWDDRYIQFSGEYGLIEGEYLAAKDIPGDFEIETVPNSWLPRTPEQKQQNLQALLLAAGGWAGIAAMPPAMKAELCETFDVTLTENSYPAAIRVARMRIKQAIKNLPTLEQAVQVAEALQLPEPMNVAPDPMTGQPVVSPVTPGQVLFQMLQPEFSVREEGHGIAAEYLSRWMLTDDGLTAPEEIRDFVGVLQDAHLQAEMMQQSVRAGVQMAGMPPMPAPSGGAPAPKGGQTTPVGG